LLIKFAVKMNRKKNILLCVAGMTPQIITETLYVLTQERGECVDEIRVITTLSGKKKLMETLLGADGKFEEFCADFGIKRDSIKFGEKTIVLLRKPDGENLEDIRTEEENEIAGNQICEIVRELCRDETTRIHASVAGGRKTMSVYLAAAMSLFGRADDCLSHVLVSEEFETGNAPDFFYKPKKARHLNLRDGREVSTDAAEIHLAEIPFVRLRGARIDLFETGDENYQTAVAKTQEDLQILEANYSLQIHLSERRLQIGKRFADLSEREFFVYVLFVNLLRKNFGGDGFTPLDEIPAREFDEVCRIISKTSADGELGLKEFGGLKRGEFLQNLCVELYKAKNPKFADVSLRNDVAQALREVISKIKKHLRKSEFPEEFIIFNKNIRQRKNSPSFGIKTNPQRFRFV
jgi:CRISPR-associated protein (TIGR02584 family)